MRCLARGQLDITVAAQERRDELGDMARALEVFHQGAIDRQRMEAEANKSRSDLEEIREASDRERVDADTRKTEELMRMVEQVERETRGAVEAVVSFMDEMTKITGEMYRTAGQLSENSETVAAAAHETQATMQEARAATDRLSASIDQVASQVQSTRQATSSAVQASQNTSLSIGTLSQVVGEIDGITQLITEIARQTSLLAINAGVEAARSGQDGRGFGVIAMEVKSLSGQTSAATAKIVELVRQVHASTNLAVTAVGDIAQAIQGVNVAANEMSKAVEDQVHETRQIALSVSETTRATEDVTDRMQQVAMEAGTTGNQAKEVDQMCAIVAEQVRALQSTLVRIVRTCSTEVDRRKSPRADQTIAARLIVRGRTFDVQVADISEGGVRLHGAFDFNDAASLQIPGLTAQLTVQRFGRDQVEGFTRLKFELGESERVALANFIRNRSPGSRRAAA